MRICSFVSALLLAASANAQVGSGSSGGYSFEMRLIADGQAGAPSGPGTTYPIGDVADLGATRIGFWLQARVAQTTGENWGVVRASSPTGTTASFIAISDPAGGSALSRGSTNAADTNFGRGSGYRSGGTPTGQTDNVSGHAAFPGSVGNQNGGLDNGGAGALTTRDYAFDCYVGASRVPADADNPSQPWGVNGATAGASIGNPIPSDGTFSPWANLYRVWIDISDFTTFRDIVINASALLNGALMAAPTDATQSSWAMDLALSNGVVVTTSYTLHAGIFPTPGAAAVLGLGGLATMRRRQR